LRRERFFDLLNELLLLEQLSVAAVERRLEVVLARVDAGGRLELHEASAPDLGLDLVQLRRPRDPTGVDRAQLSLSVAFDLPLLEVALRFPDLCPCSWSLAGVTYRCLVASDAADVIWIEAVRRLVRRVTIDRSGR